MIQKAQDSIVKMSHLPGVDMHADLLTKPLGPTQYTPHATTLLQGKKAYSATQTESTSRVDKVTQANNTWSQYYPPISMYTTPYIRKVRFPNRNHTYNIGTY